MVLITALLILLIFATIYTNKRAKLGTFLFLKILVMGKRTLIFKLMPENICNLSDLLNF